MRRIFLIGYMGAGKTTVGKDLARRLGLSFIDLDGYIEGRYRKTIGQIFQEKGEDVFREIERSVLREVGTFEDVLVSTGGGAPCYSDNIDFMNQVGISIYLKVSVGELAKRLEVCKSNRPILKGRSGEELKAFVENSLMFRDPYYNQATIIFDAENMLTDSDVHSISKGLESILAEPSKN